MWDQGSYAPRKPRMNQCNSSQTQRTVSQGAKSYEETGSNQGARGPAQTARCLNTRGCAMEAKDQAGHTPMVARMGQVLSDRMLRTRGWDGKMIEWTTSSRDASNLIQTEWARAMQENAKKLPDLDWHGPEQAEQVQFMTSQKVKKLTPCG